MQRRGLPRSRGAFVLGSAAATLLLAVVAAHAQDAVTNADQIAAAFDQHWLSYPLASPCADDSTTLQPMDIWFLDFTALPDAVAAVTNSTAEMQNGVSAWRLRLIQAADTGEVVLKPAGSDVELLRIGASPNFVSFAAYDNLIADFCIMSGRNPGPTAYDDLIADGYTSLDPPRIVMDVWAISAADEDAYFANLLAAEAEAQSDEGASAGPALSGAGGRFMAMSEDEEGGGGDGSDPCSVTNLLQSFTITSVSQDSIHWTVISWQSCQVFRYLISSADALPASTWSPRSYVWGQPNVSSTTWTDTTTDGASPITQRFYRVQRLLAGPIAAGGHHNLAAMPDGRLWAWGGNGEQGESEGGLGDGLDGYYVELYRPFPGEVADVTSCVGQTISNAVSLAADGDGCSVVADVNGAVWTFGEADHGQLGNASTDPENPDQPVPAPISGISDVVSVAAGAYHTLALRADGTVWAWGDDACGDYQYGTLGVGCSVSGWTNSPIRSLVPTQTVVVAIAAGGEHSVALDANGNVWTWGEGDFGELGNGATTNVTVPTMLTNISNVVAIAAGDQHTIALKADKTVWTWGDGIAGDLGRTGNKTVPGLVSALTNMSVVGIAGGEFFTLALTSDGYVYAWGDNTYGQLGTNGPSAGGPDHFDTPHLVAGISNAVWVSAHPKGSHSLAVMVDGGTNRYWGWGHNQEGEVGNGGASNGTNQFGLYQSTPSLLQFCTRCQRCVQLGTSGSFTAQCNGTLYLHFNGEIGRFGNYDGSFTVTIDGFGTTNVPATAESGIAIGTVTIGNSYSFTASGFCTYNRDLELAANPDGIDSASSNLVDCSYSSVNNYFNKTNSVCPAAQCFSLVGKIQ